MSDDRSYRVRSSSGSFQMRCIIVGTAYIQSTWCSSISARQRVASKRSMITMWLPTSSPPTENDSGPLWYSGPVARCTPSSCMPKARAVMPTDSLVAGPPATISFGRPVLPPDVGAFHADGDLHRQRGVGELRVRREPGGDADPSRRLQSDDQRRIGQLHDGLELEAGELGAHRRGRGAELPDRDRGLEPLDAVRQADGHERVVLHAEPGVGPGEPVRVRVELGPGDGPVGVGEGGGVGRSGGPGGEGHGERRRHGRAP